MHRLIRVASFLCAAFVVSIIFQSPTVRAVNPDVDGDGLTDDYEDMTLYVQRSAASGVPTGIIDNGAGSTSVTLLPWQGLVAGGFAEFEVDHSAKSELTVQVGYWDGTKWVDRHVWDPGSRLLGVTITQPAPNAVLQGIVTASASVPAGDVLDKVEFFLGTTLVATVPGPTPTNAISVSIDTIPFPIGNYELRAVMTDKLGASRTSVIPVRVDDTAAPTVSFVMPGSGAYVTGTTSVKVYASDASGVASVDLKVDGGSFFPITSSYSGGYYWYTWTTTSLPDGVHSLTAQAVDRRTRVSTSTVSVTVDNAAPSVSITYPSHGSVKSGSVTVKASASDASGIYAVSFSVDGSWEKTDMTSPYEFVWYTHLEVDGSHSVKATATDHAGSSAFHTITVITSNGDGEWCDNPPCPMSVDPTASMSLAGPDVLSFSTTTESTTSAYSQTGTVSTLVVDLVKSRTQVTQEDRDNRILPAEFDPALLHVHLTWRIVVRDWVDSVEEPWEDCVPSPGIDCPVGTMSPEESVVLTTETTSTSTHGTLRSYAMRLEERSDRTDAHTDDDGLADGEEALTHATYPVTPDTDGDGATDDFEANFQPITYPVNGVPQSTTVKTSPTDPDSDDDGLLDGEEYYAGVDRVVTHPMNPDTDGDLSLNDGAEVYTHHSNATMTDTDGDTIADSDEVRDRLLTSSINGATNYRWVTTLAYAEDSDGDGLRDDVEWNAGAPTDPSDADTDDDGLEDGGERWTVYAIPTLYQLEKSLESIEQGYSPMPWYTTYAVTSSPVLRDTEGDGVSDFDESRFHSDPRSSDTDQDRIPDGQDDDPTIVDIERPLIYVDEIWCCSYPPGVKRYWVTYSLRDAAGIAEMWVYKDGNYAQPVHHEYVNGPQYVQFQRNFDIGYNDVFDGARWEIWARDRNGNLDYLTFEEPSLFDAIGNFLTSATKGVLGPQNGGLLTGAWYAVRDTVVDLATLFLQPQAIFDGGRAVGNAFSSQGIGALVDLATSLYEYIDGSQEEANPYASGTVDHATFRYYWYAGYIATTIGLSLVGGVVAKAVVKGLNAPQVLSRISSALGDLADTSKVAQYIARLKGIGIVNSRILIGAVFTTAFAGAAYVWPEIFGAWFSNYIGGAFVFVSLYSLGPFGFADDVLKKAPRVVTKAGLNDVDGFVKRLHGQFGKEVTERAVRDLDGLVGLPGYERLVRNIDTSNNLGFVHEARVAAHHGASNIEELERKVRTPVGETDLDVLLKNGDIIEAKIEDLSGAYLGSPNYVRFVEDLEKQLKVLQEWRTLTSRSGANVVAFRITPHPDILKWLSDHGFGSEVIP